MCAILVKCAHFLLISTLVPVGVKQEGIRVALISGIEEIFEKVNNSTATELEMLAVSTTQLTFQCCG